MKSLFTKSNLVRGLATSTAALLVMSGAAHAALTFGAATVTGAALTLDSTTTGAVNVGTGASAKTVTIGNVTGATAVVVNSGTGGAAINSTSTGDIALTSADDLTLTTSGDDMLFTTADAFTVAGATGSIYTIGAATTTGTFAIGGTAQTGAMTFGDTAASTVSEISIGGGNGVKTAINIGDGSGANGINIGGASSTTTVAGAFVTTGLTRQSITIGITASATESVAGGTALTTDINVVDTAGASDAVTLPAAVAGRQIKIINRTAQTITVWPDVTGNGINALGANAAYNVATLVEATCTAMATTSSSATAWECQKTSR